MPVLTFLKQKSNIMKIIGCYSLTIKWNTTFIRMEGLTHGEVKISKSK